MAAGRYRAAEPESGFFWARTSHHTLTAATKVPAVNNEPLTVCVNAARAVLLPSRAVMLVSSARWVSRL